MFRVLFSLLVYVCVGTCVFAATTVGAQENPAPLQPQLPRHTSSASLKIALRLQNEAAYEGTASVRVMPEEGYEIPGENGGNLGEYLYSAVMPGKYFVEVSAPGYLGVRLIVEILAGEAEKTLSVTMKPRPSSKGAFGTPLEIPGAEAKTDKTTSSTSAEPSSWNPRELAETIPHGNAQIACPQEEVLQGVGQRMKEFVGTLERFTAIENLEHQSFNQAGEGKTPETRKFNYVVAVTQNREGTFLLEEYRNGKTDPTQFPAGIASVGLPAIDLLFHPILASDFDFRCEGLGQWKGHGAWQVHFAQRKEKPVRIRIYRIGNRDYAVLLEGRAWIDPTTFQVIHLESQLQAPIPEIGLKLEHLMIDYEAVRFRSTAQEVWLPQVAELYVDRQKKRYFRRHTFSDFELFNVDTAQKIQSDLGSYVITNLSDKEITGELMVRPAAGTSGKTVILQISVPAHGKVTEVVGIAKEVNLAPNSVGSAAFTYKGEAGQITVESSLVGGTEVEVKAVGKTP